MQNMKLTPEEAKQESTIGEASEAPAYPYGLTIQLCDESLKKLGITSPPPVGTKLTLQAMVEVTSNSQYENQDGKDVSMCLQITDMELGQAETASPNPASVLYPSNS